MGNEKGSAGKVLDEAGEYARALAFAAIIMPPAIAIKAALDLRDAVKSGVSAVSQSKTLDAVGSSVKNVVHSALLVTAVPQRLDASASPAERQEVIDGTIHTVFENLGYAKEDALKAAQHVQGGVRDVLLTLRDVIGLDGTEESDCDN